MTLAQPPAAAPAPTPTAAPPPAQQPAPSGAVPQDTGPESQGGYRLRLRGPQGQITFSRDVGEIDRLIAQGYDVIRDDGSVAQITNFGGGRLIDNRPINTALTGQMTPEQQQALQEAGISTGGSGGSGSSTDEWNALVEEMGLAPIPSIDRIDLGDLPMMNPNWAPGFEGGYFNTTENVAQRIEDFYNEGGFPTAQAAQHNMGGIPQVNAQTPDSFAALEFLLSGQGFDPATMARMRAGAADDIAGQARAQRGSGRLMAEQAGLAGSPAAMAIEAQANRRQGDATTRAMNDLEVANARQGMQNLTTGAGMEMSRQMSASQQANLVALQNASNILQAMSQNVANSQQTNMANFAGEQDRRMEQAGRQSDVLAQAGNQFNSATLGRQIGADRDNTNNQIDWRLNQAQLDRDRDRFNAGNQMQRYGWDSSNMINLANNTQANAFYNSGNQLALNRNSNSRWGDTFDDIATGVAGA